MPEEIETILEREHIELASIQKRALAFFIDELLLSIILFIILYDAFVQAQTLEALIALTNSFVLEYMAMKIIYQTFFVMQYGATIGKIAMKIAVIEIRTLTTPSFLSSFNRAIFRVISESLLYLGFLWAFMDPSKQGWHDKTARTLVVNV